ncbi:MAG TPA: DUF4097 family beta strand repeat-containing protein [Bryobacteraceae bacterium]|nr:DUF4097 family beta strand repeat-containing protein [Bryobacteraceae bacterium]
MRLGLLCVCGLSLVLAGCDEIWAEAGGRVTEDFSHSYTLKPGGRLSVENSNGSIEITGWDRDTIDISGTKYASNDELLRSLRIDIQHDADSVSIRTIRPSGFRGNLGAKYVLRVPRRLNLERIISSNGHVEIRDVEGPARVRTSNGAVRSVNTMGTLEIETSNGAIDVSGHKGAITGGTSNGRISVDLTNPEKDRPIRLSSSNGGVNLKLGQLNGNSVRISTSNASIHLALPENANAQLRASTSNGRFRSELPLQGEITKTRAEGRLGSGGPYLELTTSNGSVELDRL